LQIWHAFSCPGQWHLFSTLHSFLLDGYCSLLMFQDVIQEITRHLRWASVVTLHRLLHMCYRPGVLNPPGASSGASCAEQIFGGHCVVRKWPGATYITILPFYHPPQSQSIPWF
jgi:hypothetical protein